MSASVDIYSENAMILAINTACEYDDTNVDNTPITHVHYVYRFPFENVRFGWTDVPQLDWV